MKSLSSFVVRAKTKQTCCGGFGSCLFGSKLLHGSGARAPTPFSADQKEVMSQMPIGPSVEAQPRVVQVLLKLESMGVIQLVMDSGKGSKQVWEV